MWWNSKKSDRNQEQELPQPKVIIQSATTLLVDEKEPPMPRSYEAKPELSLDEMAEYQKVSAAIGLDSSEALFNERLHQCCAINGFRIYNNSQVVKFLNFKLGKGKWEWLGLREKDVEYLKGWFITVDEQKINFGDNQYGQSVPLPVLLTVQRVMEEVSDAHFYVSGVPGVDDDPFLLVTAKRASSFIIERWDEPDFREV